MHHSTTQSLSIQQELFEKILSKYPTKADALSELSSLLKVSKTSLYRKINNNTALKLEELTLLTKHYQLSLDELLNNPSTVYTFKQIKPERPNLSSLSALSDTKLLQQLQHKPDAQLSYLGSEIPLYYLYLYPSLIYFKECIWKRRNIPTHSVDYTPIDFKSIDTHSIQRYRATWQLYASIPSNEIWDSNGLRLLIEQITHAYEIGILEERDVKMLSNKLYKLVDRLELILRNSSKLMDDAQPNLNVYYYPSLSYTWYYIGQSNTFRYFQGAFNSPNALVSQNERMIKKALKRFDNQTERCTTISRFGAQSRAKLLNAFRRDINLLTD